MAAFKRLDPPVYKVALSAPLKAEENKLRDQFYRGLIRQ